MSEDIDRMILSREICAKCFKEKDTDDYYCKECEEAVIEDAFMEMFGEVRHWKN